MSDEQERLRSRVHGDGSITAAIWNPDLHPRGADGKFIELGGIVEWIDDFDGKKRRGVVTGMNDSGSKLKVSFKSKDRIDKDAESTWVSPENIRTIAAPKGRLPGNVTNPGGDSEHVWEKEFGSPYKRGSYKLKKIAPRAKYDPRYRSMRREEKRETPRDYRFLLRGASAAVDLYLDWEQALNAPEVDAALVASLEFQAQDMGLDLWQINNLMLNSMTAAINIQWNPDLHPRGRDGKFIESFGLVRLFDFTDRKGNRWPESSGKVTDITPDPDNPGNPDIEVELPEGGHVTVKPNQVASAPDVKARIGDRELGPERKETEFNYIGAPDFEPEAETVEEQLEEDIAFADTIYNTSRDVGMLNVGDEIILPGDMPGTIVEFEFPGDRPDSVKVHTDGGTYHGKTTDILPNYRPGEEVNPIGEPVMEKPGELGSKNNPIKTADPLEAVEALRDGKFVELESVDQVSTLLTELADIAAEAKAAGEEAPNYDLCLVSVPGTNLFCAESKGIPRIEMPQLSGFPVPGSKADSLPRTEEGGVDIGPAFMDHLRSKGVGVKEERRLASHLKASQSELIGSKIAGMMRAMDSGNDFAIRNIRENPIFVTSDGYVIDGHHRWASVVGWDALEGGIEDYDMPVRTIDMDIMEVLSEANKFANDFGIPQVSSSDIGPEIKKPETEGEAFRRRNVESELARAAEMRRRE